VLLDHREHLVDHALDLLIQLSRVHARQLRRENNNTQSLKIKIRNNKTSTLH
jgi:hypothetical protein